MGFACLDVVLRSTQPVIPATPVVRCIRHRVGTPRASVAKSAVLIALGELERRRTDQAAHTVLRAALLVATLFRGSLICHDEHSSWSMRRERLSSEPSLG